MSNEHIKSEISVYLAGGLSESRARQIDEHVAVCDKCRQALTKARAKQARLKREALKKASSDPLPNLFLARQGKAAGIDRPPSRVPWIIAGIVIIAGISYSLIHRHPAEAGPSEAPETAAAPVAVSSAPVLSSATAAAPPPAPEKPVAATPPVPAPARPSALQALQQWKGPDSGIKTMRLTVIRSKGAWEKLWAEMLQKDPLPPVNFEEHLVAAIFPGESPPGSFVVLGTIRETDKTVSIPYRVAGFDVKVSSGAVPSHPYLLSLMARVDKKIRLTQREAAE